MHAYIDVYIYLYIYIYIVVGKKLHKIYDCAFPETVYIPDGDEADRYIPARCL